MRQTHLCPPVSVQVASFPRPRPIPILSPSPSSSWPPRPVGELARFVGAAIYERMAYQAQRLSVAPRLNCADAWQQADSPRCQASSCCYCFCGHGGHRRTLPRHSAAVRPDLGQRNVAVAARAVPQRDAARCCAPRSPSAPCCASRRLLARPSSQCHRTRTLVEGMGPSIAAGTVDPIR